MWESMLPNEWSKTKGYLVLQKRRWTMSAGSTSVTCMSGTASTQPTRNLKTPLLMNAHWITSREASPRHCRITSLAKLKCFSYVKTKSSRSTQLSLDHKSRRSGNFSTVISRTPRTAPSRSQASTLTTWRGCCITSTTGTTHSGRRSKPPTTKATPGSQTVHQRATWTKRRPFAREQPRSRKSSPHMQDPRCGTSPRHRRSTTSVPSEIHRVPATLSRARALWLWGPRLRRQRAVLRVSLARAGARSGHTQEVARRSLSSRRGDAAVGSCSQGSVRRDARRRAGGV